MSQQQEQPRSYLRPSTQQAVIDSKLNAIGAIIRKNSEEMVMDEIQILLFYNLLDKDYAK